MSTAQYALGALVLLPLLAAVVSAVVPHSSRRAVAVVTAAASAAHLVLLAVPVLAGDTVQLILGGFEAPLGIHLRADGLSLAFLALSVVAGGIVTVYAAAARATTAGFWALWLGCWSGLNAVFVSGDLFNSYVGLELVGLTSVALVALGGRDAWRPALRYLFVAVLGSLLLLIGIGLIVAETGTLDIDQARDVFAASDSASPALVFALALITVGLCMKLALLPMHSWLIPAHSSAPSAVSPLLSALVIKAALFVLLRCWFWVVPAEQLSDLSLLSWGLTALGAAAVIIGSVLALRQDRLKSLVAYSTVAQVGYWFLAFGLLNYANAGADVSSGAFAGMIALALGHGVAKAGMFLSAGYLKEAYGTDELSALRGAGHRHPYAVMGMGLSSVGLMGLPISLGFTGKWGLATAAVETQHWWILGVLVLGTLLAAGYAVRAVAPMLLQEEKSEEASAGTAEAAGVEPGDVPSRNYTSVPGLCVLTLGILTIATGFSGAVLGDVLEVGAPW